MVGNRLLRDENIPDLRSLHLPSRHEQMHSSSNLRRSPRKHAGTSTGTDICTHEHYSKDSSGLQGTMLFASSNQRRVSPTKSSLPERSPLKALRNPRATRKMMDSFPTLPRKTTLPSMPLVNHDRELSSSNAGSLCLTQVDSLLFPVSKMSMTHDASEPESEPGLSCDNSENRRTGPSTMSRITQAARNRQSAAITTRTARQKSSVAANRFVLGEARCNEDVLDSDADNDCEEEEETDLSGFIVDDDAELSYHESMESGSEESEQEKRPRRQIAKEKPRRRLRRGRRHYDATEDESAADPDTERDELSNAFGNIRLDATTKVGNTDRETIEVIDLTSPVRLPSSKPTRSDTEELGSLEQGFLDKLNGLRLAPPATTNSLHVPVKLSSSTMIDDDVVPARTQGFTTPPATPPRSPTKLKSPTKLLSPSKRQDQALRSPHRQSMDTFWDQNEINSWNDQFSPKKAPLDSPRKGLKHFDLWSDSDEELERIEESSDALPSPCESPTKMRTISSPLKSPLKAERQRLQEEKKAKLAAKRAFDNEKKQMAQALLDALDMNITDGQIAKLSSSTGGVKIIWSKTLRSTAGRANWRKTVKKPSTSPIKGRKAVQELNPSVIVEHNANIELAIKVIDRPERLYNTLAHEFCHIANYMISNIQDQPHGASFCRWASKVSSWMQQQTEVPEWRTTKITTKHSYVIEYKYAWVCIGRDQTAAMNMLNIEEDGCGTEYGRHSNSINTETQRCGVCKGRLSQIRPKPRASPKKSVSPVKKTTRVGITSKRDIVQVQKAAEVVVLSD